MNNHDAIMRRIAQAAERQAARDEERRVADGFYERDDPWGSICAHPHCYRQAIEGQCLCGEHAAEDDAANDHQDYGALADYHDGITAAGHGYGE